MLVASVRGNAVTTALLQDAPVTSPVLLGHGYVLLTVRTGQEEACAKQCAPWQQAQLLQTKCQLPSDRQGQTLSFGLQL
jgi:hypothetical protein